MWEIIRKRARGYSNMKNRREGIMRGFGKWK